MTTDNTKFIRQLREEWDTEPKQEVKLTRKQLIVLELYAKGLTGAEIGEILFITEHTIRGHTKGIRERLQVHTMAGAVAKGLRTGIIT
jgi:DNA-binding CsgD family transcriptional regulator